MTRTATCFGSTAAWTCSGTGFAACGWWTARARRCFPGRYGNNGYSDEWAEFLYPCIEDLPEELYLAPFVDGRADLTQAVKVK